VSGRINGMAQQIDQASRNKTYLEGALEDLDYFESIWGGVCNDMGRLQYENAQLKAQVGQMQQQIGQLQGVLNQRPPVMVPSVFGVGPLKRAGKRRKQAERPRG
jgi:hypothetical protein